MTTTSKTIWTRAGKEVREPLLVGRKISREWLGGSVPMLKISVVGPLRQALLDMLSVAKDGKLNLPVVSLRTSLLYCLDNVVRVDRDLGLLPRRNGAIPFAVEMFAPADSQLNEVRKTLADTLRRWIMDTVEPWAVRHSMEHLVTRLHPLVDANGFELQSVEDPYLGAHGRPDFSLIARMIGDTLAGEELFDGLGACELIASPEYRGETVELMTLPKRGQRGDDVFSMVARLAVGTIPYSTELYLAISAAKRVWAKMPPKSFPSMPSKATGYVIALGHPVMRVDVLRREDGWVFGDEYSSLLRESGGVLPQTLEEAIGQREFNANSGWWAGFPELPTIYRYVSPRTVFESDEVDLMQRVVGLLEGVVNQKPITPRDVSLGRFQAKPRQEMVKLSDFSMAGDALLIEGGVTETEAEDEIEEEGNGGSRKEKVGFYREQNIAALDRVHDGKPPMLWMFGGNADEQELVRKTVDILFGEKVTFVANPLPAKTHGLKADLDVPTGKAEARFNERVKRWEPATRRMVEVSGDRPIIALICAADRVNKQAEDSVNYYAGIHAMSLIGANVHHVLPRETVDSEEAKQAFIYRVQSALLDVLLAHSGVVFGVKEFVARVLPDAPAPKAIYGIQAVRSMARTFSGESGVCFVLFSRLVVSSGMTEVKFSYKAAKGNAWTEWMPLSKGLSWLGTQRRLNEGDSRWLSASFVELVRDGLVSIQGDDPRAIVMIDWSSVASLWQGIRDEDLVVKAVNGTQVVESGRLENIPLSGFGQMTFVRLRRNANTLALRGSVKGSFEGWEIGDAGRVATGEHRPHAYFTTTQRLIELAEDGLPDNRRSGHFIASMGYRKTVQMERGFSCYRSMPRLKRVKGSKGEFEEKVLEPANIDAALPAPVEITVLHCPEEMPPAAAAILVMGLRLGFAHYNDWTSLPAPLFFRRKVEDYIIRYPEDEPVFVPAEAVLDDVVAAQEEVSAPVREVTVDSQIELPLKTISDLVVEEAEGVPEAMSTTPLFGDDIEDGPTNEQMDDPLSVAKRTEVVCLGGSNDLNLRMLYQKMLKEDVRVSVALPWWIETKGLFRQPSDNSKKNIKRSWRLMREFGYVKNTMPMPDSSEYMEKLASRLRCPQARFGFATVCQDMGGLFFSELTRLIECEFNPSQDEGEQVNPYMLRPESLTKLTQWAAKTEHDRLLGWLVFSVAQFPAPGWVNAVMQNIPAIPGPRTEEAIKYFIDSAAAIHEAIAQRKLPTTRFTPVIKKPRPKPEGVVIEPYAPAMTPAAVEAVQEPVFAAAPVGTDSRVEAQEVIAAASAGEQTPQHVVRKSVASMLDAFDPGKQLTINSPVDVHQISEALTRRLALKPSAANMVRKSAVRPGGMTFNFDDSDVADRLKMAIIQHVADLDVDAESFTKRFGLLIEALGKLKALHESNIKLQQLRQEAARVRELIVKGFNDVLSAVTALPAELDFGGYRLHEISDELIESSGEHMTAVHELVKDVAAWHAQLTELSNLPRPTLIDERRRMNAQETKALESLDGCVASLRAQLESSPCFYRPDQPTPPPTPSGPNEGESPAVEGQPAETAVEHGAEAAVSEASVAEGAAPVVAEIEPEPVAHAPAVQIPVATEPPVAAVEVPAAVEAKAEPVTAEPVPAASGEVSRAAFSPVSAIADEMAASPATVPAESPVDEPVHHIDVDAHIVSLESLLNRRLYGLARVHVAALGKVLTEYDDATAGAHYIILSALVEALDAMDCEFSFETKFNSRLQNLLAAAKLPTDDLCTPAPMALGILSAGMGNLLFDSTDVQWSIGNAVSARLSGTDALSGLVEHIDEMRKRGYTLTRDLFVRSRVNDKQALQRELQRFSRRASGWKTSTELHTNFNHRGFLAIHEELFGASSQIGQTLAHIATGNSGKVIASFNDLKRKLEKPAYLLDETAKRLRERSRPNGLYRSQVIENIEQTRRFIEHYIEHVNRPVSHDVEGLPRDLQHFLGNLYDRLEAAIAEARGMAIRTPLERLYQHTAITAMECALRLYSDGTLLSCIPNEKQRLLVQLPLSQDLMPSMDPIDDATPALCEPEDVLDETSRLLEEPLSLGGEGDDSIDAALRKAMTQHMIAKRFRPAFKIDGIVPRGPVSGGETIKQAYAREKADFVAELQQARQRVTHAMTLNAVQQDEASRMQRLIEELLSLTRSDRPIGHPDCESFAYPDFPHARAALRFNVLQPLETRLSEATERLRQELSEEEERGEASVADIARIRKMLDENNAASLRTAHDSLRMLQTNKKLPAKLVTNLDIAGEYDQFIATLRSDLASNKALVDGVSGALAGEPSDSDPPWLAALDVEQRQSALKLIEAWNWVFAQRRDVDDERVRNLFRQMGMANPPSVINEAGRQNRIRLMFQERSFMFPTTSDDPLFIPPVLGSWATSNQGFIIYGNPTENELRAVIQEIGTTPTVILSRSRLSMEKRARIAGSSPVLLVDDELLVYAALHPSERFQAMMKVAILTFATNPYDDYGLRPVPVEMFFGRQEELTHLRDNKGLGVLFGGRRLGKSSLLSQIEREENATPGRHAVFFSVDSVDVKNHVYGAWQSLYRALVSRSLIQPMDKMPSQWMAIRDWVEHELVKSADLKALYLLIDEADTLMACELNLKKGDLGFVRGLSQMVDSIANSCQVRLVFAGLHNTARMASDENSPFGKSKPISLRPYSTPDDMQRGLRLITKPLAAMGYLFGPGSEDLPLRIMSVCNYYPAFIQMYCKRLVEWLQNARQNNKPPIYITERDLDAVENHGSLLADLRDKFELNLNLDKRYKIIALILADIYYSDVAEGSYEGLTSSEIADFCELMGGRHFDNTGPGVYEALLDEMCKLNVIERVGNRYVLRNFNIAMMMGDAERVTTLIAEIAKAPPDAARNHGERRVAITHGSSQCVFPMPVAWVARYMGYMDNEVLVVLGNNLSGLMDMVSLSERDVWTLQDGSFEVMPNGGPRAISDLISRMRRPGYPRQGNKIAAVRPTGWKPDTIAEYAAIASKAAKNGLRIALLAPPERAWELATAIDSGKVALSQGWSIMPVPIWSEDAIYLRVSENIHVAESAEAMAAIKEATCGFGKEIVGLCGNSLTLKATLAAPETRRKVLAPDLATFYRLIGMPPAITPEMLRRIENFLYMADGMKREEVDLLDDDDYRVSDGTVRFLHWMGLLQEGQGHTWVVPAMYKRLLHSKEAA